MSARPPFRAPLQTRVQVPGAAIAYELEGEQRAPALVLAHGLGADLRVWDANMAGLCELFRVLRFDLRGHGRSSTPPGPYTLLALAQDAMALIDYLQLGSVYFVGVDVGARIGLKLAARYPNRVQRLVACEPSWMPSAEPLVESASNVRSLGMKRLAPLTVATWVSPEFRETHVHEVELLRAMAEYTRTEGWVGCLASLTEAPQVVADGRRVPTLVLSNGHRDAVSEARRYVTGAEHVVLPGAHLSHVEHPGKFNSMVQDFLLRGPAEREARGYQ